MTRDSWKASGSKSTRKRAKEEATNLLKKSPVKPISEKLLKELDNIAKNGLK